MRYDQLLLTLQYASYRPHHSVLFVPGPIEAKQKGRRSNSWNELPRVVFVCTAPTKDDTSLMFCDSMPIVTVFLESEVKPHCTSSLGQRTQKVPLHLCTQSHGKVSYCARIVPQIGFHDAQDDIISSSGHRVKERNTFCVVGGEDGSIKIFKCSKILGTTSSSGDTKIQEKVREDCIKNSSFVFLEEVNMPGNVAVKAIAIASRHDPQNSGVEVAESKGIIVAVGGRLTFSIWEYSLQDFVGKSGGDFGSHLSILTSGSVDPKSSQDHRILSVQCTLFPKMKDIFYDSIFSPTIPLNSDFIETESNKLHDFYLVVMGDSRGSVTVATYDNGVQVNGS